jgi:hypothetical protein
LAAATRDPPFPGPERLVGHDVGVPVAVAARLLAGPQRALRDVHERGERAIEQRHLDMLALTGPVAPAQRRQDPHRSVHAGEGVDERDARLRRAPLRR